MAAILNWFTCLLFQGHYCPNGTEYSTQYPCPTGTYRNVTGGQEVADCYLCPPGMYCDNEANVYPDGLCDAGHFCVLGSATSSPQDYNEFLGGKNQSPLFHSRFPFSVNHMSALCDVGDCLCPSNQTGGICQEGYFCPQGSYEPTSCSEGMFCNETGLSLPTGDCDPGYYCSQAAVRPDPTDANTGGVCPAGRYCGQSHNLTDRINAFLTTSLTQWNISHQITNPINTFLIKCLLYKLLIFYQIVIIS